MSIAVCGSVGFAPVSLQPPRAAGVFQDFLDFVVGPRREIACGCREIGVPQDLLHGPEVFGFSVELRCDGAPEIVWVEVFLDSAPFAERLVGLPDSAAAEGAPGAE